MKESGGNIYEKKRVGGWRACVVEGCRKAAIRGGSWVCEEHSCEVKGCQNSPIPGRIICDPHAYPAEQKKTSRRRAIESQKKAKAERVSAEE